MIASDPRRLLDDSALADLPVAMAQGLRDFAEQGRAAMGDDLRSIVLFGSAAEGRLRATSDLNLIVVVSALQPASFDAWRESMRLLETLHRAHFMVLLESEIGLAMDAFPDKLMSVLRRHRVLLGPDPFAGRAINPALLRARISQSLLNQVLRLRSAYALRSLQPEQATLALATAIGPLRAEAADLLELDGVTLPPKEALQRVAAELTGGPWDDVLTAASRAHDGDVLEPALAAPLLFRAIELCAALHRRSLAEVV